MLFVLLVASILPRISRAVSSTAAFVPLFYYRKRQNEFRFQRLRRAGRVPRSG
jgi:hypothetical protein